MKSATRLPRYQSIAEDLHRRIFSAEFENEGKLPTQKELAGYYGVAVMTIKQALQSLQNQGLVSGIRGSGTHITTKTFTYRIKLLTSFAHEVDSQNRELFTEVVEIESGEPSDSQIREYLELDALAEHVSFWRLRSIDSKPTILQRSVLSAQDFQKIDQSLLGEASLYEMLGMAGLRISHASERIRAVLLPEFAAIHLEREVDAIGLLAVRVSKDSTGKPVLLDYAYFPGDVAVVESERFANEQHG